MSSAFAIHPGREEFHPRISERERWFSIAFDHVWDAALMVGRDGLTRAVNRSAQEWFQITHQPALGLPVDELVRLLSVPDRRPVRFPWSGGPVETPKSGCIVDGDGRERWVSYRIIPVDAGQEGTADVILILHDESWRQQHEQELGKLQRLEPLTVLAGGIAHDFNNFLTSVVGNVQLARTMVASADAHAALKDAEAACHAAAGTAKQLLRFVRGGSPVRRVQPLGEVVREVARLATAGTAVRLEIALDEDLSSVSFDQDQMNQVVQNLALNAVQVLPSGGTLRISGRNVVADVPLPPELAATVGTKFVRIDFSDNGPGIAPEDLLRIFEPFYTTKPAGQGLGLAVCYSIARQHGGLLTVASTPGAGSTFTLFLPSAEGNPVAPEEPVPLPAARTRLARILLVEDEEPVRRLTAKLLTKLGYRVTTADDGEQAIQTYHEAHAGGDGFDGVITDLTLRGGIGGREIAAAILAANPDARLVVTSGFFDQPLLSEYRENGFRGALRKPYLIQDLQCAVQRALEH
ncbi:MAG: response regulator [Verrucomicrobia bacterium]|nr:response regulator [Verrucomicrobiota bacterium]